MAFGKSILLFLFNTPTYSRLSHTLTHSPNHTSTVCLFLSQMERPMEKKRYASSYFFFLLLHGKE